MNLVDKILDTLEGINDINTVIYDNQFSSNLRIDRKPAPYAIMYLLTDWGLDISKGTSKEGADIQVFFCDTANFDAKGEEKDVIVNSMYSIAKQFIATLLEDNTIRVLDDSVRIRSSYGRYDKFVVGVSVQLRIEEKQGSCIYIPEIEPEPDENNEENEG